MSENLTLWESVEKTPPSQTKEITGKSYRGNSPKPHWLVKRATETFGPAGIGWGFEIVDEKVIDGATYSDGSRERMHSAKVKVWYKWNGERGEVEALGGTIFSGQRRNGATFTDEDAPKKSVTDALIKALSILGFAGDIFLGRYDDNKYLTELRQEEAEEQRQTTSRQAHPTALKMQEEVNGKNTLEDLQALIASERWNNAFGKLPEADQTRLEDLYKRRLQNLTQSPVGEAA